MQNPTYPGARDVNNAGQVTVFATGTAYIWQNGVFSPPSGLPCNNTTFAINAAGHAAFTSSLRAAYWNGVQTTILPTLEGSYTFGEDLNGGNIVVGTSYRASILQYRGFMWNGTTMTDLGALTSTGGSYAHAINDAGVVVGLVGPSTTLPGRWQAGTWTNLPLLPGHARRCE
jgi:probable HAF family extracellular repeat protein